MIFHDENTLWYLATDRAIGPLTSLEFHKNGFDIWFESFNVPTWRPRGARKGSGLSSTHIPAIRLQQIFLPLKGRGERGKEGAYYTFCKEKQLLLVSFLMISAEETSSATKRLIWKVQQWSCCSVRKTVFISVSLCLFLSLSLSLIIYLSRWMAVALFFALLYAR